MDNEVENEEIGANDVDSVQGLRYVPEQDIFADGRYVAEEKAGDDDNRGDDAHNGDVRELLEGVRFQRDGRKGFSSPLKMDQM